MNIHSFASHNAEEMRRLSNQGHRVEGALLAAVGVLASLGGAGVIWAAMIWPILIAAAGVALLVLIYLRHPRSDWPAIWSDPQQRQHTLLATALVVAGPAELLGQRTNGTWVYVWPAALILIGALFLTHTQHGQGQAVARAVLLHRILGGTIALGGILKLADVSTASGVFAFLWPLALLAAAAQLLLYREPEGAFEAESGHRHHS